MKLYPKGKVVKKKVPVAKRPKEIPKGSMNSKLPPDEQLYGDTRAPLSSEVAVPARRGKKVAKRGKR